MNDLTHALSWAEARKKDNETAMVARCPCCGEILAIYVGQSSMQEPALDASSANLEVAPSTDDILNS